MTPALTVGTTLRSPICPVDGAHCGAQAIVESVRESAACVTVEVRCTTCGDRGCISTRKDGAR